MWISVYFFYHKNNHNAWGISEKCIVKSFITISYPYYIVTLPSPNGGLNQNLSHDLRKLILLRIAAVWWREKRKEESGQCFESPAATCFLLERAAVWAIWLPLFLIYLWQCQQMSQANPEAGVTLGVVSRFLEQHDSIVRAPRLAKPEALSIITPFMPSQTNHQSQA